MANDYPLDDDGLNFESQDSLQEFTDDRTPRDRPRANSPFSESQSADELIEFTDGGDDHSEDLVPA